MQRPKKNEVKIEDIQLSTYLAVAQKNKTSVKEEPEKLLEIYHNIVAKKEKPKQYDVKRFVK
jgi:hypothetical protein